MTTTKTWRTEPITNPKFRVLSHLQFRRTCWHRRAPGRDPSTTCRRRRSWRTPVRGRRTGRSSTRCPGGRSGPPLSRSRTFLCDAQHSAQTHKGKKVKEAGLYSAFIEVPYTQGAQVRITQCCLQITPYLPLPRS